MMECGEVEPNMPKTMLTSFTLLNNAINCVTRTMIKITIMPVLAKVSHFLILEHARSMTSESAHNQLLQPQEPITMPEQLILSNPTKT
jgi:hypothetical protein